MSSNRTVTFRCLINMGVAYKPYLRPPGSLFFGPFSNVLFCKWKHSISTPSRLNRQCKMNIQNCYFCKRCHVSCHINWFQDFHLMLYLNSHFLLAKYWKKMPTLILLNPKSIKHQ